MRTLTLVGMVVSVSISALVGCAPQQTGSQNTFHLRPVPAGLASDIRANMTRIAGQKALSADVKKTLRTAVEGIDRRRPEFSTSQTQTIRDIGAAGLPTIEEMLNSNDKGTRWRALFAVGSLLRPREQVSESYLSTVDPAVILVCRRSLLDVDVAVRQKAVGILSLVSVNYGPKDLPPGVAEGLADALRDPDASVRDAAHSFRGDLGLEEHDPSTSD